MIYQVRLQPAAVEDLDGAYRYAAQNAPAPAARWLQRFQTALQTLEHNPERCPLAPENAKSRRILRQYLFGKRPHVFRVIYAIEGNHAQLSGNTNHQKSRRLCETAPFPQRSLGRRRGIKTPQSAFEPSPLQQFWQNRNPQTAGF